VRPDELEHLGDARADVLAAPADDLEGEGHVLPDGLVRQELEVLEDVADLAAQQRDLPAPQLLEVLARDPDLAAVRDLLAGEQRMKVDLPDPDGPTTNTNSPLVTSRETDSSATTSMSRPRLKDFVTSWRRIKGAVLCRLCGRTLPVRPQRPGEVRRVRTAVRATRGDLDPTGVSGPRVRDDAARPR
jgi:hypothetical protein